MLNYLQFYRDEAGQADAARREYRNKYGVQAVQAVHRVGGQFLFSGTIEQVTIAAKRQPSPVQWDDLAAMIYPDPTAIFYMEQHEPYRNALKHRDNSLERSDIVATVAY